MTADTITLNGEEYVKKGEQFSPKDYMITDRSLIMAIIPMKRRDDDIDGDIIEVPAFGTYKLISDSLIKFESSGLKLGDVCMMSKSRYSTDYIKIARRVAKPLFDDTPEVFLAWDKDKGAHIEHQPCLLAFDRQLFIVIAPRIQDETEEEA